MILLGVGTAVPDIDRENTHMLWDGPGGPLLIDAGGSTYQRLLRAGYDPQQLRGVLLTHNHTDHINGIPALLFSIGLAGRTEPLPIYGLPATLELLQHVLAAFEMEDYVVPVRWQSLEVGASLPLSDDAAEAKGKKERWQIRTARTRHTRPCLALRFEDQHSGIALVHSADTAPVPDVAALAQGAHTLIHEASMSTESEFHTTPRQAGEIARQAGAQRLVIVHFSPRYTMPEAQALADIRAGGFGGIAEIGREYQAIELPTQTASGA
jgi:ribonuclease Z